MKFDYDDEQRLLAESVQRLLARDYTFEARRVILASAQGWSPEIWNSFAELGLLGLGIAPDHGGFGGGAMATLSVMEAIGEALVVEPYLATVGLGARLVAHGATPARAATILPGVVEGRVTLAMATTEDDSRYDLARVATRARRDGDGYILDGHKRVVVHAPGATFLLVTARTSGPDAASDGVGVFLVDPAAAGVSLRACRTLDGMRAADVTLAGVRVDREDRIGDEGAAGTMLADIVDHATALLCAEAVGALRYANAATLDHLKQRRQFGVPIGTFQALQHRMVDMTLSYEQAKSMAALACTTVDTERDPARRRRIVSAAKVRIADAARHVSQEAVQLHGGMGMSDELKISHTFRRLTVIAQQFGDADHHLQRFAAD
ncbi:MAG TPA: acyl-CoA dehydrogenase [Casimicrobiaceae bacterium]|nr:acyl-CoA dehydrogenase [Casimicrobiaceae bacterium]